MKTKQEILKDLFDTLAELESGKVANGLKRYLKVKLETLYEVMGEDVPEEYWDRIEKAIN